MDELEIQGKIYISSKRAHELTGYAKDYIGQLVRLGKLPATKVGRAWYVERDTILKTAGLEGENGVITVEPQKSPIEARTPSLQSLNALREGIKAAPLSTWTPIRYFSDDGALLPVVTKEVKAQEVPAPIEHKTLENKVILKIHDIYSAPANFSPIDGLMVKKSPHSAIFVEKATHDRPGLLMPALSVAVFFILAVSVGGTVLGTSWNSSTSEPLAASFAFGGELGFLKDVLLELLRAGFFALGAFFALIFGSFRVFFDAGIEFIVSLFHLG